jgi:hypothetical protein
MDDILVRGWENFVARTSGPLNLRFYLQPTVAAVLAIRAGLRDARAGRPAYFWSLFKGSEPLSSSLQDGAKDIGKVVIIAMILDSVYQLIVLRGIYVLELVFTATMLAVVPYILLRGPVNRIARGLGHEARQL